MIFEITEDMKKKIREWDTCNAIDVSGAKFAYTFIPTSIGLFIEIHCDVCNRRLTFSDI
ncbi:hypothetical protein GCM10008915_71540 [Bifidobacterium pullorum subsp. gallinarum]